MATKTPLRLTGCEKGTRETSWRFEFLQGLKPGVVMIGFNGPAKAVPLLQSMSRTISSASEVSITRFSMRFGFGAGFGRPYGTWGFCRRRFPGLRPLRELALGYFQCSYGRWARRVAAEEQKQILRLTTPKLENVWGPVRSE
jgi:hypothetical protein